MPLDGVVVVIEDEPITSVQVLARLELLQALAKNSAPRLETPLTMAQAYKELVEARLLSWDASRKRISVSDAEMDRMMELLAKQVNVSGGRQALLALLTARGIDEANYREYSRQQLLFAKLDRLADPVRPRAERLRELEAEAQILDVSELLSLAPSSKRSCTPATPTRPTRPPATARATAPAGKGSPARVAGICIEGEATPQTAARLEQLGRTVKIGGELDRTSVSRAQAALLSDGDSVEAATVYAVSTQPREPPEKAAWLWVVFRVRERPFLAGFEHSGLPAGVSVEPPPSTPSLRVSQRVLRTQLENTRDALREAGYRSSGLKLERRPVAAGERPGGGPAERVRLMVTPGPRTRLAQVELVGAGEPRRAELLALLPFHAGDPYQEIESMTARFMLDLYYRDRGYLRAHIGDPEVVPEKPAADGSPQLRLRYAITEGPQVRLSALRFTGELPLAEAELRRLMKSGVDKVISTEALRKDIQALLDAAKAAGKPVQITPNVEYRKDVSQADLTLHFAPDPAAGSGMGALKQR